MTTRDSIVHLLDRCSCIHHSFKIGKYMFSKVVFLIYLKLDVACFKR